MIESWETEIIQKLEASIEDCGILEYPEKPSKYFVKHKTGEILVRYDGTRYIQTDVSESYQEREVTIELIFCYRKLRGNGGLYQQMENVRNTLYGYKLEKASTGIQFEREDLIGEDGQGIWEMGLKLKFKALFIPNVMSNNNPATNISVELNSSACSG